MTGQSGISLLESADSRETVAEMLKLLHLSIVLLTACAFCVPCGFAQDDATPPPVDPDPDAPALEVPEKIDVTPVSTDFQIADRLARIMEATGKFDEPSVEVIEGVVFLRGTAHTPEDREWCEKAANKTQDVVAVYNEVAVRGQPIWDLKPAETALEDLFRSTIRGLPLYAAGILIAFVFYWVATWASRLTRWLAKRRTQNQLLQQVFSSLVAVVVFLIGLYIALKVAGLSRLAVTVLGGTGLIGLALGFAFRDIAENYLASILISLNHPFNVGDRIAVENFQGYVRRVTTRGTILVTDQGNHVQIPNATVYKNAVVNFTASPRSRLEFSVGIGYDDPISEAQRIAREVIEKHPATLNDPKPAILVDSLGASTVNLRCLFWFNLKDYSGIRVKSAIIRQVKQAFTQASISMPDESREIVFPTGVPVRMLESQAEAQVSAQQTMAAKRRAEEVAEDAESTATEGEGSLASEATELQREADSNDIPDQGTNLL